MKKIIIVIVLSFFVVCGSQAQMFVGLNAGAGLEKTSRDATGVTLGVGADFGFLNTSLGTWGLFGSRSFSLGTSGHTALGVVHLPSDWDSRTGFMWGVGIDLRSAINTPYGQTIEDNGTLYENISFRDRRGYGVVLRAGVSFKDYLYLTGSLAFGSVTTEKDIYSMSHTSAGLHFNGYGAVDERNSYFNLGVAIGFRF